MKRPSASTPDHAEAHQGLAYVLAELGDEAGRCNGTGAKVFRIVPWLHCRIAEKGPRCPCCCWFRRWAATYRPAICWTTASSRRSWWCPSFTISKLPLPPHQVVFNAIGDADLAAPALAAAQSLVALTAAPVINLPSAVLATGRADHARLSQLPGVVTPATVTLPRELLASPEAAATLARHGFHFPLLVRTPGFHTGRHFVRVESPEALARRRGGTSREPN